ncbi:carbon-nitrogen hydrolase [Pyrenochaeta sp. MPI-SDFR-AT-0127]|nr:carbon-nitrogen hydrolase [Pyrenochaeta sp. MPI-SDFR-AT-0127]
MPRFIRIAAAQVGAVHRSDNRESTLERLLALLGNASSQGAQILLFDKAKELGVDICIGFAEATSAGDHYNTCVYYHAKSGSVLAKYRKIHLPGDNEPSSDPNAVNQLEKRYFKAGNLGFNAFRIPSLLPGGYEPIFGMMLCNDRRWSEAWRCLGLQGVEVVLIGSNTPGFVPHILGTSDNQNRREARAEAIFHHMLVMQAHSYTNACFSVSAVRCGLDDGKYDLIGGSAIFGPDGKIIADSKTEGDEVVVADCDLDRCLVGKQRTFDFARRRRIEHYGLLTSQTGIVEPPRHFSKSDVITNTFSRISSEADVRSVTGSARTKQIRILLCNPNATESMTNACLAMLAPTLPPDVTVYGFTAPKPAPSAIEGSFDNIMSAATSARAIIPIADEYDAFLVACYSDHALIKMLREEISQPVVGIMEASLFAARTLGGRFGIIATSQRSRYTLEDSVRHYGLEGFCAGVRSCTLGVLELESKPEEEVLSIMCDIGLKLVQDGADVLTLGCAGMTNMKSAVEKAVGGNVQVIDGVQAGVQHLSGLCRLNVRTAKSGVFASSADGRKRRGQQWY